METFSTAPKSTPAPLSWHWLLPPQMHRLFSLAWPCLLLHPHHPQHLPGVPSLPDTGKDPFFVCFTEHMHSQGWAALPASMFHPIFASNQGLPTLLSFSLGSWFPLFFSHSIFCMEPVPIFYVKPLLVPQLYLPTHNSLITHQPFGLYFFDVKLLY